MLAKRPAQVFTRCRRTGSARPVLPALWLAVGLLAGLAPGTTAFEATPLGAEFQVNTYTSSLQQSPSVAVDPNGEFVVVWTSFGSAGSDSSYSSIQGQRYTVQAPPVPSLAPPGVLGLALLLFGVAAAALRGRLLGRA